MSLWPMIDALPIAVLAAMVSPWLVVPLAGVVLLVIAVHLSGLQQQAMPARQRRVRTASGLLMMLVTGLLAWAMSFGPDGLYDAGATPASRSFAQTAAIIWLVIVALLILIVMLAAIDALQSLAYGFEQRRLLRQKARAGKAPLEQVRPDA